MKVKTILMTFLILVCSQSFADSEEVFNHKRAVAALESVHQLLKKPNVRLRRLKNNVDSVSRYIADANSCIARQEKNISAIKKLKVSYGLDKAAEMTDDDKYIKARSEKVRKRLGTCRLFLLKADEVLSSYQTHVMNLAKKRLWARDLPVWQANLTLDKEKNPILSQTHLRDVKPVLSNLDMQLVSFAAVFILLSLGASYIRYSCKLQAYLPLAETVVVIFLFSAFILIKSLPETYHYLALLHSILIYLSLRIILSVLISAKATEKLLECVQVKKKFIRGFSFTILNIYLIVQFVRQVILWDSFSYQQYMVIESSLLVIASTMFLILMTETLKGFSGIKWVKRHTNQIIEITVCTVIIIIGLNFFGYHRLVNYLSVNILLSALLILVCGTVSWMLYRFYYLLTVRSSNISQSVRKRLLVDKQKSLLEFTLLHVALQVVIYGYLVINLVTFWDISFMGELKLSRFYFDGAAVFNIRVVPVDIINGLIVFSILNLLVRFVTHYINQVNKQRNISAEYLGIGQILYYIGSCISVLSALLVAGVSLTGLAIVAGAFSVGVGLALRGIISNFFSGMIMLIERPIKIGDYISVDGVSGLVKKIRVRTTQVRTEDRVDILIPNEKIITGQLQNYMLARPMLRLKFEVKVAFDSDPKKIEEILLAIANEQEEVITEEEKNKPEVMLLELNKDSMRFELRVVIKHVHQKNTVHTTINHAIKAQFKQHKIEMG